MTPMRAIVWLREGRFVVETVNRSAEGVGLSGPAQAFEEDVSDHDLGAAVVAAARHSERTLVPAREGRLPTAAMRAAGVRSWKAFARDARSVHAEVVDDRVELDPMQPADHDSFEPHGSVESTTVAADPATVGRAVRSLLDAIG